MIDDRKEATRNPTRDPDPAEYSNTSRTPPTGCPATSR